MGRGFEGHLFYALQIRYCEMQASKLAQSPHIMMTEFERVRFIEKYYL